MTKKKLAVTYVRKVKCEVTVEMTVEQEEELRSYIFDAEGYDVVTGIDLESVLSRNGRVIEIQQSEVCIDEPISIEIKEE